MGPCFSSPSRTQPGALRPRSSKALVSITVVGAVALSSCTIGNPKPSDSNLGENDSASTAQVESVEPAEPTLPASATQDSTRVAATPENSAAVDGDAQAALDRAIAVAVDQFGGQVGVAVAGGGGVVSAGATGVASAWSTSKVPLAIAAQRAGVADPATVSSAITYSDNQSADRLWQALGSGESAASAVQNVLAETGDATTRVQEQVTRPGFSAFGQTQWSVSNQARFAAKMACLDGAAPVLTAMGTADPAQSYGLRQISGSRMKGGWGPDSSGAYEVRQFGLVQLGTAPVAVAIFARPGAGSYEAGQAMLSLLSNELSRAQVDWPSAGCS